MTFGTFKGAYDAHIDLVELAVRATSAQAAASKDPVAFWQELKDSFGGVSSNPDGRSVETVLKRSAEWYVFQTHAVAESIFREIRQDISAHRPSLSWDTKEQLSPLDLLLLGINAKKLKSSIHYALIDYYGAVRDHLVHGTKRTKIVSMREAIREKWGTEIDKAWRPGTPNVPGELSYSDYKVYTRAVTNFIAILNDACALTPADIALFLTDNAERRAELLRKRSTPASLLRYVKKICSLVYRTTEKQAQEVYDAVAPVVADIPSARERRRQRKRAK